MTVFPKEVISLTEYNEEFRPKIEYIQADYGQVERAYHDFLTQRAKRTLGEVASCSCVQFGKAKTGFSQSIGKARNWPINSNSPSIGGVVVLNESWAGHVAYITSVTDNSVTVRESNYIPCRISTRTIQLNNPKIIGYWINI